MDYHIKLYLSYKNTEISTALFMINFAMVNVITHIKHHTVSTDSPSQTFFLLHLLICIHI